MMNRRNTIPAILVTLAASALFIAESAPTAYVHGSSLDLGNLLIALTAMYSHANVPHLAINLAAIWIYRPYPKTFLTAFICAYIAMLIPSPCNTPSCGLSGLIFACYSRAATRNSNLHWTTIWTNVALMCVFRRSIDACYHLTAYAIGFAAFRLLAMMERPKKAEK